MRKIRRKPTNVQRLEIYKMSNDAVPNDGGVSDAIGFLLDRDRVKESARNAKEWVRNAIEAVRLARDPNPYKEANDETIAEEILRRIHKRPEERT